MLTIEEIRKRAISSRKAHKDNLYGGYQEEAIVYFVHVMIGISEINRLKKELKELKRNINPF